MLDVATAVIGARQPECLQTDERDGFGFHFAEAPRRHLRIAQACVGLGRAKGVAMTKKILMLAFAVLALVESER